MQELLGRNVGNLTGELNQTKEKGRWKVLNSNKSFKRWVWKRPRVFQRRRLKSRFADRTPQHHVWVAWTIKENWDELQETCEKGGAARRDCLHSHRELRWRPERSGDEELGEKFEALSGPSSSTFVSTPLLTQWLWSLVAESLSC